MKANKKPDKISENYSKEGVLVTLSANNTKSANILSDYRNLFLAMAVEFIGVHLSDRETEKMREMDFLFGNMSDGKDFYKCAKKYKSIKTEIVSISD